jgi:hypothetical protein
LCDFPRFIQCSEQVKIQDFCPACGVASGAGLCTGSRCFPYDENVAIAPVFAAGEDNSDSKTPDCPSGQVYDSTTKQCVTPLPN